MSTVVVTIVPDGPAIIRSDDNFIIVSTVDPKGEPERKIVAICRCGKSADGVWCDGSHKKKNNE